VNKAMRWTLLPATLVVASLTLAARASTRLARLARAERATQAERLGEWENEGGALARAAGHHGMKA
jgi:hypothetical protein